jgi:hypothetical protein
VAVANERRGAQGDELERGFASKDLTDAEAQLASIRDALVARVMAAPTRVLSLGWIDSEGALRESTQFATDARVRGIRVVSYLKESEAQGRPQVVAEVDMPVSLRALGSQRSDCLEGPSRWRVPLAVSVAIAPGLQGQQAGIASWLGHQFERRFLLAAGDLQRWAIFEPSDSADRSNARGAYRRALLGTDRPFSDWRLHLQVDVATLTISPPYPVAAWWRNLRSQEPATKVVWRSRMSLLRQGAPEPVFEVAQDVPLDPSARDIAAQVLEQWTDALAGWMEKLDAQAACTPLEFALEPLSPGEWSMPFAALSGFKAGDKVLILDRRSVPRKLLEPGTLGLMVLAEVVRVMPNRAVLRQMAGPQLPRAGEWVALPI